MVQAWLRDNYVKLKPGEAVVMNANGEIVPMQQTRVQEILAESPEHFGMMAAIAANRPGDAGVAPTADFVLVLARDDTWCGWATPSEVGGVIDNTDLMAEV